MLSKASKTVHVCDYFAPTNLFNLMCCKLKLTSLVLIKIKQKKLFPKENFIVLVISYCVYLWCFKGGVIV